MEQALPLIHEKLQNPENCTIWYPF